MDKEKAFYICVEVVFSRTPSVELFKEHVRACYEALKTASD